MNINNKKTRTKKRFRVISTLILPVFCFILFQSKSMAANPQIDSTSIYILKRMTHNIQNLNSLSFNVVINYDVFFSELGLVKYGNEAKVKILFPKNLLVETSGFDGNKIIVYDKDKLQIYNYDRNTYAKIKTSGSVAEMIDQVSNTYKIDFPAADFLYPRFVEDVLETVTQLSYLGTTSLNGKSCYHIAAKTDDMSWQLWVSDDAMAVPVRLVIVYTNVENTPQYQADFTDWTVNPNLSSNIFNYTPIYGATEIEVK